MYPDILFQPILVSRKLSSIVSPMPIMATLALNANLAMYFLLAAVSSQVSIQIVQDILTELVLVVMQAIISAVAGVCPN